MRTGAGVLACAILTVCLAAPVSQSGYDVYQKALVQERAHGNLKEAIALYERVVREFAADRQLAAKALLQIGGCYGKLGRPEAAKAYEQLLREYAEQGEPAAEARRRLRELKPAEDARPRSGLAVRRIATDFWNPVAVGAPSSDGRYLPLVSDTTRSLAIRDLASGEDRPLIKDVGIYGYHFLSLSPDGKQIAYRANRAGRYEIRVAGLNGAAPTVIHDGAGVTCLYIAAWSPDGKQILVELLTQKEQRTYQIALVSVQDGSVRILKNLGTHRVNTRMSFSPDGRHLVYTLNGDLRLLSADGSTEFPLDEHPADDSVLGWSPDGSGILFTSDRSGTTDAWFLPMSGAQPRGSPLLIRRDIGRAIPKGFTPGGAFYYVLPVGSGDVYLATLDQAGGKTLSGPAPATAHFPGTNFGPAFSPTGRYVAFGSRRPALRFCVQSFETGETREVGPDLGERSAPRPTFLGLDGSPDWSPDERELVLYGSDATGNNALYRIDAWTGALSPIVRKKFWGTFRYPAWSPDGKAVFYVEYFDYWVCRIVRHELETAQDRTLLETTTPSVGGLALSADGRILAFPAGDDDRGGYSLQVMPAAGGAVRELLRVQAPDYISALAWMPDSRHLLFAWDRGGKKTELWRIPAGGGTPEPLGLAMDQIRDLRVHPDGRRIAFTGGGRKYELWVMENFLPPKAGN